MSNRFIGILERPEGSLWSIWFPDCPGCVTAAETMDAAIAQAPEALRLWLEGAIEDGEDLPEARFMDQLLSLGEVAEAISQGGVPFLVPAFIDQGRPVRANISLDAGTLAIIDAAAKSRGLTRSAFLVSAAKQKILAEA